ncbi:MAG: DNA polymerase III subunit beta [Minisyncoccales bacterium]
MKIIILKDKLKEGVNLVSRIPVKSVNLPILNNILISVKKNFLTLITTDLELGIKWQSLVKTEKEGQVVVPIKILSNFINFLPNKQITLETSGFDLKIICDNYQTIIKGNNPDEFPIFPQISNKEKIEVPINLFCEGINSVVNITNPSLIKPEISGVYFSFQKKLIIIAATDSFRLGEKKLYLESLNNINNYSLIIPQRAAKEIVNIFGEKEGDLTIYFSPNQLLFETTSKEFHQPEIQFISRLIEGDYPNYQEIIPTKYETTLIFPLTELINQIKLASLFSSRANEIKLKTEPSKHQLKISSQNLDVGEHQSFILGQVKGKAIEISFNHRFLLEGLLNLENLSRQKKAEVVLNLINSEKPAVLRLKDDDSYLYLVMPIKNI